MMMARRRYKPPKDRGWFHRDWRLYVMLILPVASSVSESIEPATIIFATLPILVVYPFVQRYFVSGVTIGAIKG